MSTWKEKIKNIKYRIIWLVKEILKTFSNKPSFFSSKRIERAVAFVSGEITLLSFFFYNLKSLPTIEAIMIATVFFAVAGYVLNKTEKSKDSSNLEDSK